MDKEKKFIWAYLSMKKGTYDNDYYFYEDGKIIHHYDISVRKYNLEGVVTPEDISESEKEKIMEQCEKECNSGVVNRVREILKFNKK